MRFIKISERSFLFFLCFPFLSTNKRKKVENEDKFESLEDKYEADRSIYEKEYNTKMLLPVKTRDGIERRYEEIMDKRPDEGLLNLKYVYVTNISYFMYY